VPNAMAGLRSRWRDSRDVGGRRLRISNARLSRLRGEKSLALMSLLHSMHHKFMLVFTIARLVADIGALTPLATCYETGGHLPSGEVTLRQPSLI
jgi:hypothetical protein